MKHRRDFGKPNDGRPAARSGIIAVIGSIARIAPTEPWRNREKWAIHAFQQSGEFANFLAVDPFQFDREWSK